MVRLAWITDPHFDFADAVAMEELVESLEAARPDGILLGGDIGEAPSVLTYLQWLDARLDAPGYLVLGNHDFYRGSIANVRAEVARMCRGSQWLTYLADGSLPVALSPHTGLIGHGGWADAREGDYHRSLVMMNDYLLIEELAPFSKRDRLEQLHQLGDEAADFLRGQLRRALAQFRQVMVLTHVPPFRSACWYEGQVSDDEWAPHFVAQAVGRAILDVASYFPEHQVTVLCGHTHHAGECFPAANVRVITGGAEYGKPAMTRMVEAP